MLRLCRGCILGASLLLPVFGVTPALAADVPDVAIVGLHQAGLDLDRQEELTRQLLILMKASGKVRGLTAPQVAGTVTGREKIVLEEGLLGPGRAKLKAAQDLYNQAQPDAAISLLGESVFQLERAFPGTASVEDLWTAHLYRGSANLQLGVDGAEAFEAAVALAPDRSPDPAKFPPDVVSEYDAARERLQSMPTHLTVNVTSAVPVVVDGVGRGAAPARAEGLLPGVHHVVVAGYKGSRGYQRLVIKPPEAPAPPEDGLEEEVPTPAPAVPSEIPELAIDVVLEEPFLGTPGASRRERSAQTASLYRALGTRASDVEYVLLGGVDGENLYLQLYHAPSDAFSRPVEVPYQEWADDEVVAAVPLLLNLIGKDGTLVSTDDTTVPLDIGANSALASLLLDPPTPVAIRDGGSGDGGKKRGGLILGIVAGAAVVGLAGGGAYLATRGDGGGSTTTTGTTTGTPVLSSGTIVVDF